MTAVRRPTPLDPYPEPRPTTPTAAAPPSPAELGVDAIAVLEGRTFLFSDSRGDVPPGSVGGLVHEDTRFVSRWELTLDGGRLSLLKSGADDYCSAGFFLTNAANSVAVRRLRRVGQGMREEIGVLNTTSRHVALELRLSCGADFADLFEVRSVVRDRSARISTAADPEARSLRFRYAVPGFVAETTVAVDRSEIVEH